MSQRSNRPSPRVTGKPRAKRPVLLSLVLAVALSLLSAAVAMGATIIGNQGPDNLTGTPRHDRIFARAGADTVTAMAGPDRVRAGADDDTADGGPGPDRLHGNAGNDVIEGGPGFDLITGNAGSDRLDGGPGCDRIFAGPDDDAIDGGAGFSFRRFRCERLHGGVGNDVSAGGVGRDFMSGGPGDDVQNGDGGADRIFANPGRDKSDGGDGRDDLWALARVDVTALGDPDGDELTGGEGNDRFHVRDGEVDLVHCGGGDRDLVLADQFDAIDADCERVERHDVTSLDQVEDGPENRTENPPEDNDEGL